MWYDIILSVLLFVVIYYYLYYVILYFIEIGDIAGVAEVTITKSYKLMRPRAAELFPEGFVFHTPVDNLPIQ